MSPQLEIMQRRTLLATTGTVLSAAIAGCGSSDPSDRQEGSADDGSGEGSADDGSGEGSADDGSGEGSADDGSGEGSADDGSGEGSADESESEQQIELLDHEFYEEEFSSGVSGTVENVSGEVLSYVEVQVYFLDSEGTQIGEGLDNTSDLAEGRRWEFDAAYLDSDPERIDTYEIETDVSNF